LRKFLNPKNYTAFKRIFGTEKNKDILIHFLNDMINFKEKSPILDVTFLKTDKDPDTAIQRTSIIDVLCKDANGHSYIIEMQVAKIKGFEKRAQYYASKAYSSQAHIGDEYQDLKEIIFLAIADYVMFPDKKEYKSDHVILDKKSYEHDLKDFSFTFIELPKFTKTPEELSSLTEKWCYFFKHAEETSAEDFKKIIGSDAIIERAYDQLNEFYWTEQELLAYDQTEKRRRAYLASMEQKYDERIAKGIEQGELNSKPTIAKNLFNQGLDIKMIETVTGLTKEETKKQ
jgi:predicted transposase/invertase (TIGR01784 family)